MWKNFNADTRHEASSVVHFIKQFLAMRQGALFQSGTSASRKSAQPLNRQLDKRMQLQTALFLWLSL
ncbi:MAG: hypothetical protein JF609_03765 [Verrucomicrobia bacterium]|nr:hypothetical protein [Verrucomicrobiota bacterium]